MSINEIIIKDTHRGLLYEDGVLVKTLEAGRYKLPGQYRFPFLRNPKTEIILVDMRKRDLTIKGQEILTSDKVAIRVSILVQFAVVDPRAAVHTVENYEDRLYSDVQLAARRSLAAMALEEILTNRHRLSSEILSDVKETAAGYGIRIDRADVKDLIFPGNLQDIMNKVLAAERTSQAQLVEARTKAEVQRIQAQADAEKASIQAASLAEATRLAAEAEAEAGRLRVLAETKAIEEKTKSMAAYETHPALMRLEELSMLRHLASNGNARLYFGLKEDMLRSTGEEK